MTEKLKHPAFQDSSYRRAPARLFCAKNRNFTLSRLKTCIYPEILVSLHVFCVPRDNRNYNGQYQTTNRIAGKCGH